MLWYENNATQLVIAHTSSKSSLTHRGIGVPQYRFREIFQSRALANQLPKRLSPIDCGTLPNTVRSGGTETDEVHVPPRFFVVFHELIDNWLHPNKPGRDGPVE